MKGSNINTLLKVLLSLGLGVYLTWYLFDIMSEEDISGVQKYHLKLKLLADCPFIDSCPCFLFF